MKINSFFDKSSSNTSKKIQITASGVQNIVNGASVERLQAEVESLKSSLELSETKLQTTIEEHLKDKEQFSIAIRKSKEAQTETSKYAEQNNLLKLDNKALTETIGDKDKLIEKYGINEDSIIEAIEHIEHPWCIGVQWHPEFLITKFEPFEISILLFLVSYLQ